MTWEERLAQEGYVIEDGRAQRHAAPRTRTPVPPPPLVWPTTPPALAPHQARRALPLIAVFPGFRLVSESNQREHWAKKHQRAKDQRYTVYYTLRCTYWVVPPLPLTITLTRLAPRELDADNLVACFKATQDAVADWLAGAEGKGQDRQPGLTWQYAWRQGTRPREYGLEICIEKGIP
jgi:hypothetical protein